MYPTILPKLYSYMYYSIQLDVSKVLSKYRAKIMKAFGVIQEFQILKSSFNRFAVKFEGGCRVLY